MWAVFLLNVCMTHNLNHICGQTAPELRVAIWLAAHFETHIHSEGSVNSTDVQSLVRCHLEAAKAHTVLHRESGPESDEGRRWMESRSHDFHWGDKMLPMTVPEQCRTCFSRRHMGQKAYHVGTPLHATGKTWWWCQRLLFAFGWNLNICFLYWKWSLYQVD